MSELVHRRGASQILLWIVGDGPLRDQLQTQVRGSALDNHVRFEGFQPNPLPYVRNAQLHCLPSLFEGMSNALAEAMACGTPVLASDCPSGPREMLCDGRLGRLIPPADSRALADAIQDAIMNYDTWSARLARSTPSATRLFRRHRSREVPIADTGNERPVLIGRKNVLLTLRVRPCD